ncbi:ATP-dependent nuclease [Arthrobacter sp. HLT1-21]
MRLELAPKIETVPGEKLSTSKNALSGMFQSAAYDSAIRHIRFPRYKNLTPGLKIEFTYPITALVGGNGTNKTSILRAIEACPEGQDLGNWWFSTSMDPIASGEQPRYIYGYRNSSSKKVVEVRKVRIERKDRHTDYWESSKAADGMDRMPAVAAGATREGRSGTRWNPVSKPVIYLDFRGELPAYDKYMRNPSAKESSRSLAERKNWIRQRSVKVRAAFAGSKKSYYGKVRVHEVVALNAKELAAVSKILGRSYKSVEMVLHEYFDRVGWTVSMRSGALSYSEAYAGSGEFAIVTLVHQLSSALPGSMVLLDEPETSLHPASQQLLMDFLVEQVKLLHLQVVMATHSPYLIADLPSDAIKLLQQDASGAVVLDKQEASQTEAFFRLGAPKKDKLQLIVEDKLAAEILHRGLKPLGEAALKRMDILPFPGGSSTIISRLVPNLAFTGTVSTLVFLDGDQRPSEDDRVPLGSDAQGETRFAKTSSISDDDLNQAIHSLFPGTPNLQIPMDGGDDSESSANRVSTLRRTHSWIYENVHFMPGESPEEYVCEMTGCPRGSSKAAKAFLLDKTAQELDKEPWELPSISSEQIFATQQRLLIDLPVNDPSWEHIRNVVNNRLTQLP